MLRKYLKLPSPPREAGASFVLGVVLPAWSPGRPVAGLEERPRPGDLGLPRFGSLELPRSVQGRQHGSSIVWKRKQIATLQC